MVFRSRIADEQTSSLGGWLFADLFLLVMVVGLAGFTISKDDASPTTSTTTTVCFTGSLIGEDSFVGRPEYSNQTTSTLLADLEDWIEDQSLQLPKVAVAIVKGGYKGADGSDSQGQSDAKNFWNNRAKYALQQYVVSRTEVRTFGTKAIEPGNFEVELFFVETANQC